jgi:hypothetical protein
VLAVSTFASVPAGTQGETSYLVSRYGGNTVTSGLVLGDTTRVTAAPGATGYLTPAAARRSAHRVEHGPCMGLNRAHA